MIHLFHFWFLSFLFSFSFGVAMGKQKKKKREERINSVQDWREKRKNNTGGFFARQLDGRNIN